MLGYYHGYLIGFAGGLLAAALVYVLLLRRRWDTEIDDCQIVIGGLKARLEDKDRLIVSQAARIDAQAELLSKRPAKPDIDATNPAGAPSPVGITTDPSDPNLKRTRGDGQQECYLVLSDEERAKGFVRPVRRSYRHVGQRPKHPTRPLTDAEHQQYSQFGYVCYEEYPRSGDGAVTGRFWTQAQLDSGCGQVTTMGQAIAETYARDPKFYGSTYCVYCGKHLRVGQDGEFVWEPDGSRVGS